MPGPTTTTTDAHLHRARAAFERVQGDPVASARELAAVARDDVASPLARAVAHWGLGRVRHDAGAHDAAVEHFETALLLASQIGDAEVEAEIRTSAAVTFQTIGRLDRALAELDLAASAVRGAAAARWAGQRALVLLHLGRPVDAVAGFDRAVAELQASDDRAALARTLLNRAVAHLQRGAFASARTDLLEAHAVAGTAGEHLVAAGALHNLGHLDGRLGRTPSALAAFEQARATYLHHGGPGRLLAALDADHGEVLLAVGLAPEALEVADALVADLVRSGDVLALGPARLMRARALTILGRADEAVAEAGRAAALLAANGREAWAAMAAYVGVVAGHVAGATAPPPALSGLADLADALDRFGWRAEAAEVRIVHGRLAIERGDVESARAQLGRASRAGHGAPIDVRAQAALAAALLHVAESRPRAAQAAARRGLDLVATQRASVGSRELRAALSAVGVPLVELGTQLALAAGRPAAALRWAERGRAVAMATPLPSPPDDPEVAAALAELRELDATRADVAGAAARISRLERQILRRRRLDHGPASAADRPATAGDLGRALGGDVLVEHVASAGRLHAVVVRAGRAALAPLCRVADAERAIQHVLFSLRRLTLLEPDDGRTAAARRALAEDAADLDALLFGPLRLPAAPAGLVVVPTGALHDVPWSALPTSIGRELTIAPSASAWLRRARSAPPPAADHDPRPDHDRRPDGGRRVVLVSGPGLDHARREIAEIEPVHEAATVLTGPSATVAAVLAHAEGAAVVHVAAHGYLRADRPMFSSLRLVDGPLVVHDLEHLATAPDTVVLTACEAGRSVVAAGDELLGTAAALVSLGVRTVVAPVVPVGDLATVAFATDLHRHLAAGARPAAALRDVLAAAIGSGDPAAIAAAMSFQCMGVGSPAHPG